MKHLEPVFDKVIAQGHFPIDFTQADDGSGRIIIGSGEYEDALSLVSYDNGDNFECVYGRFDTPRMIKLQDGTFFSMGINSPVWNLVNIKAQKKMPHVLHMKYAENFDELLEDRVQMDFTTIDIPGLSHGYGDGQNPKVWQIGYCCNFCQLDNGDILIAMYGQFREDKSKCEYFTVYDMFQYRSWIIVSHDNGRTFEYLGTVADCMTYPWNPTGEGFCEPDIIDMGGGHVLCALRTQGHEFYTPMYICHSYDYGKTWSVPEKICDFGVYPRFLKCSDGTLLIGAGKWDTFLLMSEDGGKTWSDRIIIKENKGQWDNGPSGYVSLMETAPGEILIVYDNVDHPHPETLEVGKKRFIHAAKYLLKD